MTRACAESKVVSLRERLPKADPAEAAARNRALALLSSLTVEDPEGPLALRARAAAPGLGGWLRFDTGTGLVALSPALIAGQPVPPLPDAAAPDLPAALHQLSRLEPLIAAVERAIGLPLDPVGLGPPAGFVLQLEARRSDGELAHRARVSIEPECAALWPEPTSGALGAAALATVPLIAHLLGPTVPTAELAELAEGDMVVLPRAAPGGWGCALSTERGPLARGVFDLADRRLTIQILESSPMLETAARPVDKSADDDIVTAAPAEPMSFAPRHAAAGGVALDTLTVRLRVALGEVRLPLKTLAGLQPGAVVTLPGDDQDLRVELLAEDQPIATGRLVSLGDAYGVLVDEVRAG